MTTDTVFALNHGIHDLINQVCPNTDCFKIYGFTNHMDMRAAYTINYMIDNKIYMSHEQRVELARVLEEFLDYVEINDGTYVIPSSGTYKLKIRPPVLRNIIRALRMAQK